MMTTQSPGLALVSLLVRDYDAAIAWYTSRLPFVLAEDTPLGGGKRWVVLAPSCGQGTGLLLARADGPGQERRIGDQAGGRVFLFLRVDDAERQYAAMTAAGVAFEAPPRHEPYCWVAVFRDLYRNRRDISRPARPPGPPTPCGRRG
ncbi:VOC family protein, partial [Nostoc sp. NIES-2111]